VRHGGALGWVCLTSGTGDAKACFWGLRTRIEYSSSAASDSATDLKPSTNRPGKIGGTWRGPFWFSPILKTSPLPHPRYSSFTVRSRAGHRASTLGSGHDVPRVARIPAATTSCRHARPVVERVGAGLQRRGACLPGLLYDRQHRACEALGLSVAGLATTAADSVEVRVAQLQASQKSVQNAAIRRQGKRPGLRHGG
jgi:hypothetical protein